MSAVQLVDVTQDFTAPAEQVYALLSEHENLGPLFGARITRLRDGDTERNGVGSMRRLKVGPLPAFEETINKAVPNELIGYTITRGTPLRSHQGLMKLSPQGEGTRLHYTIEFDAALPGVAWVVKQALAAGVRKAMRKAAAQLS